jgi:hypothetical protein
VTRLSEFSPNGRLFALGSFLENYRISPHFCATFILFVSLWFNFDKNGLGYILGDSFKNSSGHPEPEQAFHPLTAFLLIRQKKCYQFCRKMFRGLQILLWKKQAY